MAMEIKTLNVDNAKEAATIEFWSQFGWTLKSSQRVFNKDSHLELRGSTQYSVTETVDFTKLVFERDKSMPNYEKIKELEEEYLTTANRIPKKMPQVPKSGDSFETWVEKNEMPDCRTALQKAVSTILLMASIAIGVAIIYDYWSSESPSFLLFCGGIGVILVFSLIRKFLPKIALKAAVNNTKSKGRALLDEEYKKYKQACDKKVETAEKAKAQYIKDVNRLPEIIKEIDALL